MVVSRKPTVLTPSLPRASRAKAADEIQAPEWHPRPGQSFRVRASGWPSETLLLTDDELDAKMLADELGAIFEVGTRYGFTAEMRSDVVTVAQLVKVGKGREIVSTRRMPDGSSKSETRYQISVEGQRETIESMGL